MDERAAASLAAQIAMHEAALAALPAIGAVAQTLSTAEAIALARALDSRSGVQLRLTISRGTASSFELSIPGTLGRRVLAACAATQDSPRMESS